ncbi:sugar phosphate nucleotidyltransferase [Litoricolaceae bacterium]|nr:sugar phosphate nucleotidyltransferase [Litorivicinaceae bacterium]
MVGGKGTRFAGTGGLPKPLESVRGRPILWHVMKIFEQSGVNDFVLCVGYKKQCFVRYFADYHLDNSTVRFSTNNSSVEMIEGPKENWAVTLKDSGVNSGTAERIRSIRNLVGSEAFCVTYGDSVVDVSIKELLAFHRNHKKIATVTAVRRRSAVGELSLVGDSVTGMVEKGVSDSEWISGGFFIFEPSIFDVIRHDMVSLEDEVLPLLVSMGQLQAFRHDGFWHPMDTVKDRDNLEQYLALARQDFVKIK